MNDPKAKITIWLDSVRKVGADIYSQLYPEKAALIDFQEVDRSKFPDQVLEFNSKDKGWPDVVFAEPEIVNSVVDAAHHFPLDLKPLIPAETLAAFEPGVLGPCTFDGKLYCLRHDVAPLVLYYNKPLMDQFGYAVPQTWEEYQALSDKVASEHPGYVMGTFGDAWGFKTYFEAAGCPSSEVIDASHVRINFTDERCVRAARLVDHMRSNGTLVEAGLFDDTIVKSVRSGQWLTLVAAAWMALYAFDGPTYSLSADHQLGVAAPLRWADEANPSTSTMGGAAWIVSNHTRNAALAVDFIVWMVSAKEFWVKSPDYPIYEPVQETWHQTLLANPLFANDPFPAFQVAARSITSLYFQPDYDVQATLDAFVRQANKEKKPIEDYLPRLQEEMTAQAKAAGYEVVVNP